MNKTISDRVVFDSYCGQGITSLSFLAWSWGLQDYVFVTTELKKQSLYCLCGLTNNTLEEWYEQNCLPAVLPGFPQRSQVVPQRVSVQVILQYLDIGKDMIYFHYIYMDILSHFNLSIPQ